ncbi:hypothetical protein R6Q59_002861 [Mikania micrantha]
MAHMKQFEHLKVQLEAIQSATNNFADESCIGKGGFGKVYKGKIAGIDGNAMVAVKCLDRRLGQGDSEFWKEIMMLSLYKHTNIVSLLGFCDDCGERILVYEYLPNKSLDLYLNNDKLTWIVRLKICIGAARGLAYLHSAIGTQQRVLHRDIKSSNILLDNDMNAKISDFGLSKFGPANQKYTFLFSNAVGTQGYYDPLYAENGFLTKESDVYSFGVVLFEVLCGRLCIDYKNNANQSLVGLARKSYEQNTINDIVYNHIRDEINLESLQAFATIAYQCLKRDREERPLMSDIVTALENSLRYQTMRNNQNPVWKETFKFAVKKPAKAVLRLVVCSSSWIKKSEVLGDVDISVADVVQEKHMNIYNIGNSRIHVELQWVGMPVKTKPKVLHFMTLDIGPHRLSR